MGTETIEAINIKTQSEIVNYQGEKVDVRIFGLPIVFSDYVKDEINMEQEGDNLFLVPAVMKNCYNNYPVCNKI